MTSEAKHETSGSKGEFNEYVTHYKTQFVGLENDPADTQCMLCNSNFVLPTQEEEFLKHLFAKHRLVIGDVSKIASLRSYVHYWRVKFSEEPLMTFCTTMLMDCDPEGKPSKGEIYYLLSDCIAEDKTLRDELRRVKLEWILAQQSEERTDSSFKRGCMFCRMEFTGFRATYLNHLSKKHNVQLGKPENLVFIDKLLDKIQNSIEKLTCIFCQKLFKDRIVLKEHMRKKLHKRINPSDKSYDEFYVTNYLEAGSTWRQRQSEFDEAEDPTGFSSENEDEESSWADWNGEGIGVTCLLCSTKNENFPSILEHMKLQHQFDFDDSTKHLNFYEKVKVVNYLRRQIGEKKCIYCDEIFDELLEHMMENDHQKLPAARVWNQPEFYFPLEESDSFLYHLDENSDDEDEKIANASNEMENTSLNEI